MIVTCDVVEAGATADSSMFVDIDSAIATTGFSKSLLVWGISALLVSDPALATDTAWLQPVASVVEYAVAQDAVFSQANLSVLIVETATSTDRATSYRQADITESATATDAIVDNRALVMNDAVLASDTSVMNDTVTLTLVSRATAFDLLLGFNDYVATDSALASDTALLSTTTALTCIDTVTADDVALVETDSANLLVASATASDTLDAQLDATTVVSEYAAAHDKLLVDAVSLGWVMNTESFAMSRYTQLPFSTMAVVKGRVLGLGEAGLYELAGETDLGRPIAAYVTTGRSMLGTNAVKRIPSVYLSGSAAGQLDLSVSVYGTYKGTYTYSTVPRQSDAPRGHRVSLGRGLASVYWKFKLANKNGARFEIDTINADVAPSTNRRV